MKFQEILNAKNSNRKVLVHIKKRGYPTREVIATINSIRYTDKNEPLILLDSKVGLVQVFACDVKPVPTE